MKRQLTSAFICLRCRSVFKRPSHRRLGNEYQPLAYTPHCPHCRTVLHKVGDTFRAPAKDDFAGWTRIERAIGRGQTFVRDENFGQVQLLPGVNGLQREFVRCFSFLPGKEEDCETAMTVGLGLQSSRTAGQSRPLVLLCALYC
jgi:hypothetical protein